MKTQLSIRDFKIIQIVLKRLESIFSRIILITLSGIFPFFNGCSKEGQNDKTAQKPNIVLINVDDLGYGDLGCYGAIKVKTPNIDKLATEGRMFTDAHSASAVCTPSRYSLLTGRYPSRENLWKPIFLKDTLLIDTSWLTLGSLMKEAGYSTACIGKWHLGFGKTYPVDWNKPLKPGPLELGFDYYFGIPVVSSHPPFVYVENQHIVGLTPDDPMVYGKHAETRWFPEKFGLDAIGGGRAAHALYDDRSVGTTLKEKAVEWIKQHKNEPFFLYLATTNIHHPFTPAPRFIGKSNSGRYGDFIQELDWIVSEVLRTLDEERLKDNTLVIFTSDNGGMLNQGGQDVWRDGHHMNGNLFGFKFDAWEGGHRVPFIARWPGKIPASTKSDQLICNVDMLATFAAIINRPLKEDEALDSRNILKALTGNPETPVRDQLIISPLDRNHLTIRKGDWVYIPAQDGGGFSGKKIGMHGFGGSATQLLTHQVNSDIENGHIKRDAPPAQLYNLRDDPRETKNIYTEKPEIVKELNVILDNYIELYDIKK